RRFVHLGLLKRTDEHCPHSSIEPCAPQHVQVQPSQKPSLSSGSSIMPQFSHSSSGLGSCPGAHFKMGLSSSPLSRYAMSLLACGPSPDIDSTMYSPKTASASVSSSPA